MIEPITEFQMRQVEAATGRCIDKAAQLYDRPFDAITVDFDLKGKCAGMYQVKGRNRRIRYNPWLFAKYFDDSLSDTVAHEVAHYVIDCLYGLRRVKPHGVEWKSVMVDLGAEPKATGSYDLTGIPVRQYAKFAYKCGCRTHQLTSLRHKKILQRRAQYCCQYCHGFLVADIAASA
jgi:SprT protein